MMDPKEAHDQDVLVDLEEGNYLVIREENDVSDVNFIAGQATTMLNGSWNELAAFKDDHHMPCCSSPSQACASRNEEDRIFEGEMTVGLLDNSAGNKEKKKRSKKPPRPPRPSISSPLDAADQKLVDELSERAMLKRARIERMKALKKMKNSKPASPIGNFVAVIITVIFCLLILWQGFFSRHAAFISFHGPPSSPAGTHSRLISIQFYKKNDSAISLHNSSEPPNNMGTVMGLEIHGEASRVTE